MKQSVILLFAACMVYTHFSSASFRERHTSAAPKIVIMSITDEKNSFSILNTMNNQQLKVGYLGCFGAALSSIVGTVVTPIVLSTGCIPTLGILACGACGTATCIYCSALCKEEFENRKEPWRTS